MKALFLKLYCRLRDLAGQDEGQDLVEYGLLLVLIALVAVTSITTIGSGVLDIFSNAASVTTSASS